jgi:predicted negative regulator of RcsB-dependent stress response
MMDWQNIINLALGSVIGVVGWFARQIWDSVQTLKEDIKQIEIDLPTNYARKVDIDARFDKIEHILQKIFDRLDSKADK